MKLSIAFKYIRASKSRTTLTILGIALALALMLCIGNFFSTITHTLVQNAINTFGDYHVRAVLNDSETARALIEDPRVEKYGYLNDISYYESVREPAKAGDEPSAKQDPFPSAVAVLACDASMEGISPIKLADGHMPEKKGEIVLSSYAASLLGNVKTGDALKLETGKYEVSAQGKTLRVPDITRNQVNSLLENNGIKADNEDLRFTLTDKQTREYTVAGIMKSDQPTSAYDFSNNNGTIIVYPEDKTQIAAAYCLVKNDASLQGFVDDIKAKSPASLLTNEMLLFYTDTDLASGFPLFGIITAVFVFVACIVGLAAVSIVRNTFSLTVTERLTDYGLLRCAGATPRQILTMLAQEVGFMLVLAVPLGLILGTAASLGLVWIVNSMEFTGLPTIYLAVSPLYCAISIGIGLIATFIAVINPFRVVTRISPVEVTRGNRLIKLPRRATRQNRLAKLVFGFEGDLSLRNMKRNGKRSRTVLVSLTICVALFICASGLLTVMSEDFERSGSQNYIDISVAAENPTDLQRYYPQIQAKAGVKRIHMDRKAVYDIVVNPGDYNQDLLKQLGGGGKDGSDAIQPSVQTVVHIIGRAAFNESIGRLSPAVGYDAWVKSGGVLAYNYFQISSYSGSRKGQIINGKILPGLQAGRDLSFTVDQADSEGGATGKTAGVNLPVTAELKELPWYEKPNGSYAQLVLFVPEENAQAFTQKMQAPAAYSTLIYVDAGGDNVKSLAEDIQSLSPSLSVSDMNQSLRQMNNAYLLFVLCIYGFVGVISLISCLNIINIISTNLILRRREFGLLQAVGMSVKQVRRLVFYESFLYSLKSIVYGVVLGVGLMLLFFSLIAGQYTTNIGFNYFAILYAALGAFLVSLVAAWPTLRRLRRMSVVDTLRSVE